MVISPQCTFEYVAEIPDYEGVTFSCDASSRVLGNDAQGDLSVEIESSQAVPAELGQLTFAGLGRRMSAFLIDGLISATVFLLLVFTMLCLRILGFWTPPA